MGYNLLFALLFTSILGFVLQTLVAHLTLITGFHLAELCCAEYPAPISFVLFLYSLLSVVAFDVAPVIGTAFALQTLFHCPLPLGMLLSALDTLIILFLQRNGRKSVEVVVEGLLGLFGVCILVNFALSRPALGAMISGTFAPDLTYKPSQTAILAVGILGSVVMSHNLFLHSGLIKLRHTNDNFATAWPSGIARSNNLQAACSFATWESAAVLFGSFIVNGAVLSVAASQFFPKHGLSAFQDIGLQDASVLLHQVLGTQIASYAWAIALLCSGHAATVTGTLASQFLCEGFLGMDPASSLVSLVTRGIAIVPAVAAALIAGSSGADKLVVACQIVIAFALPLTTIPLLKFVNHPFVTKRVQDSFLRTAGVFTFAVAVAGNVWIVWDSIHTLGSFKSFTAINSYALLFASLCVVVSYICSLAYLLCVSVHFPGLYDSDDSLLHEESPLLA